jgi:hypothetical protein
MQISKKGRMQDIVQKILKLQETHIEGAPEISDNLLNPAKYLIIEAFSQGGR